MKTKPKQEKPDALKELRQEIIEARKKLGAPQSYSPQVIGLTLKTIAKKFGKAEANKAIRELGLVKHGWTAQP